MSISFFNNFKNKKKYPKKHFFTNYIKEIEILNLEKDKNSNSIYKNKNTILNQKKNNKNEYNNQNLNNKRSQEFDYPIYKKKYNLIKNEIDSYFLKNNTLLNNKNTHSYKDNYIYKKILGNNNINEDIKSSKMKKFEIITNNINNIYDDYDDSLRDEVKRRKQSNYTFYESKSNKKINTDPNNIDIEKNCYPINKYLSASIKNENIINNCYTNQNKNNSTLGSNFNFDKKSSKDHLDGRNYNNHSTVFISNKSKPLIKSNYNNHLGIIESNNENNNLKNDFRQSTHSHNNNFVCNIINTEISEIPEDNNYYHLNVKSYKNNSSDIIDYSKGENINNKEKKLKKKEKIKSKELIENRGKGFYKVSKNRNIASTGIIKINQKENKFKTSENNNREININKDKFFSNSEKKQILEDFLKFINSSSISIKIKKVL